jgi:tripartite-type tricarboxylate transporter receptor subunit TctC
MKRRTVLAVLGCTAILCMATLAVAQTADDFPNRPIRIIVPQAAGSGIDIHARILAQKMGELWGQTGVVENRAGANAIIGMEAAAKAAPDGYTLLLAPSSIAIAPSLYGRLPFDPAKDFAPVVLIGSQPMIVVVHPSFPAKSIAELIAMAKQKPGEISYASAGNGSTNHLAVELFKNMTGVDMLHVPYRGNPLAIVDVIAGRVPVFFDFVLTGLPHVREGKVRALAVTGAHRASVLPDVPTVAEAGVPGFEASTWFAVYTPAGAKPDVIDKLNREILVVLALPNVKERLSALGVDVLAEGPDALAALTKSDLAKWGPIIQKAGIKLD